LAAPLNITVAFRIDDDSSARIAAVDPRVQLFHAPELASRHAPEGTRKDEVFAALAQTEVMFGQNRTAPEYFDAAPKLKWFQAINAGIERMDNLGLLTRGFAVTTAAGLASTGIAEYAIGTMIMLARDLHGMVRNQDQRTWARDARSLELRGKTLAVLGLGEIGRETARRARAFGMYVIASRRTAAPGATDPDCDELLSYSEIGTLLARADFLVVAVPLTAETNGMLGAAEIALMKHGAFVVNVARGAVFDQAALTQALSDGRLAGAALDVFDPEPLATDDPLWTLPNVIVTPHISGSVEGYTEKAVEIFVANLRRYIVGEELAHRASPELGY
jgi:phosphoglycerate dehydrogenase-like enzyme